MNDFELAKQMANDENFSHRLNGHLESNIRGIDGSPTGDEMKMNLILRTIYVNSYCFRIKWRFSLEKVVLL